MNKDMKLVTIIVPIYNVEKYLDQCINSILAQTYKNIEIILVNDGSTDGSLKICKKYAELDNRIRIIDKENGGLSDARNAGLDVAKGEYIGFVDSDDWIAKDMYRRLVCACEMYHTDIAACKMKKIIGEQEDIPEEESALDYICLSQKETLFAQITLDENIEISVSVCCKLFKKELIDSIRFQKGVQYEDILFSFDIIKKISKCAYDPEFLYYYRIHRNGSITNSWINRHVFSDLIPSLEKRVCYLENMGYKKLAQIDEFYLFCKIIDIYFGIYEAKKKELYNDADMAVAKIYHNPKAITYVKSKEIGKTHKYAKTYKLKLLVAYLSPKCMYIIFRSIHRIREIIKI